MQSASSRFWTRVAVSIFYDDNYYTTGTSTKYTGFYYEDRSVYLKNFDSRQGDCVWKNLIKIFYLNINCILECQVLIYSWNILSKYQQKGKKNQSKYTYIQIHLHIYSRVIIHTKSLAWKKVFPSYIAYNKDP